MKILLDDDDRRQLKNVAADFKAGGFGKTAHLGMDPNGNFLAFYSKSGLREYSAVSLAEVKFLKKGVEFVPSGPVGLEVIELVKQYMG